MAKNRQEKDREIELIENSISGRGLRIFFSFSNMKVSDMRELKRKFDARGLNFRVIKKTLLLKAFERAGFNKSKAEEISDGLKDGSALGWGGDEQGVAKVLYESSKLNPHLIMRYGLLDGLVLMKGELNELAKLPERKEIYAKLAYAVAAPLKGMLSMLNGQQLKIIYVLNNLINKRN